MYWSSIYTIKNQTHFVMKWKFYSYCQIVWYEIKNVISSFLVSLHDKGSMHLCNSLKWNKKYLMKDKLPSIFTCQKFIFESWIWHFEASTKTSPESFIKIGKELISCSKQHTMRPEIFNFISELKCSLLHFATVITFIFIS